MHNRSAKSHLLFRLFWPNFLFSSSKDPNGQNHLTSFAAKKADFNTASSLLGTNIERLQSKHQSGLYLISDWAKTKLKRHKINVKKNNSGFFWGLCVFESLLLSWDSESWDIILDFRQFSFCLKFLSGGLEFYSHFFHFIEFVVIWVFRPFRLLWLVVPIFPQSESNNFVIKQPHHRSLFHSAFFAHYIDHCIDYEQSIEHPRHKQIRTELPALSWLYEGQTLNPPKRACSDCNSTWFTPEGSSGSSSVIAAPAGGGRREYGPLDREIHSE